jgi:uncharacterized Tic20 family protein
MTTPLPTDAPPTERPLSEDDRNLAALSHALVLLGYVVPAGNVLAPLVIYLMKRDSSPFVTEHARESLNFQITQLIAGIAFVLLAFVGVGCVLLVVQLVFELVVVFGAAMAARDGKSYRYPLTLRLV